jgi:ATP-dependent DNA helicase RecQ
VSEQTFDLASIQSICADWVGNSFEFPDAKEGVFERIRQIFCLSRQHRTLANKCDFVPLIRQVLLRASNGSSISRLRVPVRGGWPTLLEWKQSGFSVLESGGESLLIAADPVQIKWIGDGADLFLDAFQETPSRLDLSTPMDPFLENSIPFDRYHASAQREALRAVFQMPEGETLIANLPTGSGKSLLIQAPVLVGGIDGALTVVVVPTIALVLDQAARMSHLLKRKFPTRKAEPLAYYGGATADERTRIRAAIRNGTQGIVFSSPESVIGSLRPALLQAAEAGYLRYFIIDEAHLVSSWGDAFRPAFQILPAVRRSLLRVGGGPLFKTILLSATLTSEAIETLQLLFGPAQQTQMVAGVHLRGEPRYWSYKASDRSDQMEKVMEIISLAPRPYILYVTERDRAKELFNRIKERGYSRVRLFHGGTNVAERETILNEWSRNEIDGVVATSAFGLGVDKSDVRSVIHATLPESLDRYYQEVGRSGRDGKASGSLLIFTNEDVITAQGISEPTLIRNETGFARWRLLFHGAVPHPNDMTCRIVDLDVLPSHLNQLSDANRSWNLRTLTLMVRARLIELVAISNELVAGAEHSMDDERSSKVTVRILAAQHLEEEFFGRSMDRARSNSLRGASTNLALMKQVANQGLEVSYALAKIYSVMLPSATSLVEPFCSGCPKDWGGRKNLPGYSAPMVSTPSRFSAPESDQIRSRIPHLVGNSLNVMIPGGLAYERAVHELLQAVMMQWPIQQVILSERCPKSMQEQTRKGLQKWPSKPVFLDLWSHSQLDEISQECTPIRMVIFEPYIDGRPPTGFLFSPVSFQLALLPSQTQDPLHPNRTFEDVTPDCMRFEDFMRFASV